MKKAIIYLGIALTILLFYLTINKNTIQKYQTDDNLVNTIIANNINISMTDYEKVKAIHDYIVLHTKYDIENLENNSVPDLDYTAKGVLENGIGVCRGYAEAFKLLMDRLNIDCRIITGYANNTTHAWNVVKIDGEWYQIDITFDDPVINENQENNTTNLRYDYFLVTDYQMYIDHELQSEAPVCTSDKYMYMEKKYNVPYEILDSIKLLPKKYADYYLNGNNCMTFYYPENVDIDQSGILDDIGYELYRHGRTVSNCTYTTISKCGQYYYTTITIN